MNTPRTDSSTQAAASQVEGQAEVEGRRVYRVGTLSYTRPRLAVLFFWLLWGDFCYQLMETVVPSIMPFRFKALDAPNWMMGMIMGTIPMVINTVLNPLISFKSDRYRSRWGRRIPFILLTLPCLVICLIGLGYSEKMGLALHDRAGGLLSRCSPATSALIVIGIFMTLFSFFNTFVNAVFWYLFNDVVPEQLLAKFMSWFRVVSLAAGAVYNWCIFKQAETHSSEVLLAVAIVYLIGFGLMCFNVREGQYPPPPAYLDGQAGPLGAIKTYFTECMGLWHYWYLFLMGLCMAAVYSGYMFFNLFYLETGLTMDMIGKLNTVGLFAGAVAIPISGWLADRYHPLRVVMAGLILQIVVATPATCIWLFWNPSPDTTFYLWVAIAIAVGAPIGALVQIMDPPLFMRIFPRDRYGQFCSANALCRSVGGIIAAPLAGVYLDLLTKWWGRRAAYCSLPLWFAACYAGMLVCLFLLYRSWQRYGGDAHYVPPLPGSAVPLARGFEVAPAAVDAGETA